MLGNFLENYFRIEKAYRKFFQAEMEKYHFTPNEILVILYLNQNDKVNNTAKSIAQFGGVSKGLIARSVDSLSEKGYIFLERDSVDRRIIHLYLTDSSKEIVAHIAEKQRQFMTQIQSGIPKEHIHIMEETLNRFIENVSEIC